MSVFRFRMQSILDMKGKLEEQAKQDFAQAQQKLLEEQQKLDDIIKRREDYIAYGIKLRSEELDVFEIMENKKAIEHVKELEQQQRLSVNVAQKAVDVAFKKMTDARVQTKTYEKLREHALEEFMLEENRAENKQIDELNSYRSARK